MILTIDIGNTRVKWLLFNAEVVAENGVFEYKLDAFKSAFTNAQVPLKGAVVVIANVAGSRVEKLLTEILETSECESYAYAQSQKSQCGVVNSYRDFSRLGVDRWLAMIAGFKHKKRAEGESVCIIDCGTAMTLDVVDASGCHLGGVIAPGYRLMQSMLMEETSDINEFEFEMAVSSVHLAKQTNDAVRQGCIQLLVGGLDSMITRYVENQNNKMCCIVTGGDAGWVGELLKIEIVIEPMLVNQGLWYVSQGD